MLEIKKAIIDLDDVLAIDGFLNMVNYFNNSNYTYDEIDDYYVEQILPKEKIEDFWKFFNENNVYDFCNVAAYSKEVLIKLMLYYDLYICSSYYSKIDNRFLYDLIPKKCEFLSKNYPFIPPKNYIFATDKTLLKADLKIDDVINNLTGDGIKLLYSAYHNENITKEELKSKDIIRVNGWGSIEMELNKRKVFTIN